MSTSLAVDRWRRISLALFGAGLLLFACGRQPATPPEPATNPPPPAATDTLAPTPTITVSPEPSPSPTEPALQLEVLEWHRWNERVVNTWDLDRGWGYVYALVRNPHEFPVEAVGTPTAKLLDGTGQFVYRSLGADLLDGSLMGIGQIPPGETVGLWFCACGTAGSVVVPEWATFELDLALRPAQLVPVSTDIQLRTLGIHQNTVPSYPTFAVWFTGSYNGSQPLRAITVRMTVRDRSGNYLGSGEVGILGDKIAGGYASIQPGASFESTVSINLDPAFVNETLDYEITAVGSVAQP